MSLNVRPEVPCSTAAGTVWAVEDDSAVRDALAVLCESAGWRFAGFSAAETLLEHTFPEPPACLVLDVELPGMSGLELQRWLNAHQTTPLPMIFVSAFNSGCARRALAAGALDFLCKPMDPEVLLADMQRAITQSLNTNAG